MIQRIQSVYLLVATILLWGTASMLLARPEFYFAGYRLIFVAATVILGVGTFAAIFLFGNRSRQHQVVRVLRDAILVVLLLMIGIATAADEWRVVAAGDVFGVLGAFVAPIIALITTHLARTAIKRDIDLIKSVDRLR